MSSSSSSLLSTDSMSNNMNIGNPAATGTGSMGMGMGMGMGIGVGMGNTSQPPNNSQGGYTNAGNAIHTTPSFHPTSSSSATGTGTGTGTAPMATSRPNPMSNAGPTSQPQSSASSSSTGPTSAQQQQQQQLVANFARLIEGLSSTHSPETHLDSLRSLVRELMPQQTNFRYANYLLTRMNILHKLKPLLEKYANHQSLGNPLYSGILEWSVQLVAYLSFMQWTDPQKQKMLTDTLLFEKLTWVFLKAEVPALQAHATRALWNLVYDNMSAKKFDSCKNLLQRLCDNMSCKSDLLRGNSIGLLWALCDKNPPVIAELCQRKLILKGVIQGLDMRNNNASGPEIYYLLLSLLNSCLQYDTSGFAKKEVLNNNISTILMALLSRTASSTLTDRILEVWSIILFPQSPEQIREQDKFTEMQGVRVLVKLICASEEQRKDLRDKCIQRLSLALLSALYHNKYYIGAANTNRSPDEVKAQMLALEETVEPAFRYLCATLLRFQLTGSKTACSTQAIAVSLTLACLAQYKPKFLVILTQKSPMPLADLQRLTPANVPPESSLYRCALDTEPMQAILLLLKPDVKWPENYQIKIKSIGLGLIQQLTSHATFPKVAEFVLKGEPAADSTNSALHSVTMQPNGVYGKFFKVILDCMAFDKLRAITAKTITFIQPRESLMQLYALLLNDHEKFLTNVFSSIRASVPPKPVAGAPPPTTPPVEDYKTLLTLSSALYTLCALDAPNADTNFRKLTQLVTADSTLTNAFTHAHQCIVKLRSNQQKQSQPGNPAAVASAINTINKSSAANDRTMQQVNMQNQIVGGGSMPRSNAPMQGQQGGQQQMNYNAQQQQRMGHMPASHSSQQPQQPPQQSSQQRSSYPNANQSYPRGATGGNFPQQSQQSSAQQRGMGGNNMNMQQTAYNTNYQPPSVNNDIKLLYDSYLKQQ